MNDEFDEVDGLTHEQVTELRIEACRHFYSEGMTWKEVRRDLRRHRCMKHLSHLDREDWVGYIYQLAKARGKDDHVPGRDEIHEMVGYDS